MGIPPAIHEEFLLQSNFRLARAGSSLGWRDHPWGGRIIPGEAGAQWCAPARSRDVPRCHWRLANSRAPSLRMLCVTESALPSSPWFFSRALSSLRAPGDGAKPPAGLWCPTLTQPSLLGLTSLSPAWNPHFPPLALHSGSFWMIKWIWFILQEILAKFPFFLGRQGAEQHLPSVGKLKLLPFSPLLSALSASALWDAGMHLGMLGWILGCWDEFGDAGMNLGMHVNQFNFGFYQQELINASQINVLYLQWHFTLLYWFQGKSCLDIIKINPGGSGFYEQPKNQSPIHENTQMCSNFFSPLFVNEIFIQDHKVKSLWGLTGETSGSSECSVIRHWDVQERGKYSSELKRLKPSEWLHT